MTLSATADLLDASPAFIDVSTGLVGASLGTPAEPYTVQVVNKAGVVLTPLPLAFPGDITEVLSGAATFSITFPKDAYARADVDILGNSTHAQEIQILLGDEVIAWGPALAPDNQPEGGAVTLTCAGVDWYFAKRAIDGERPQLLPNGGFESGLTDWNDSGTAPGGVGVIGDSTLATIETDTFVEGTQAVRVTALGAPTGLALVSDPFTFTGSAVGTFVCCTFSLIVETLAVPALFEAGVMLTGSPPGPGGAPVGGVNAVGRAVYRVDKTTPTNVEIRGSVKIHVPANTTWAMLLWLFAPETGSFVYDNIEVFPLQELTTASLSGSPQATVDVSRIVQMLAQHTLTTEHDKSDLFITVDAPLCGVKMARTYPFSDHLYLDQALGEFIDRDDCFDYAMVYTQTTRALTLFPISSGGKGTDRSADVTLTYGQAPFSSYTPGVDGGSCANQIAALGDGTGPVREEGWATDATAIGGTTLQATITAPPGTQQDSLIPLALQAVAERATPAEVLQVTITRQPGGYAPDATVILQDLLEVGDRVAVAIPDGWYTYSGVWRIVQRVRHCRARTMTYTLNPVL